MVTVVLPGEYGKARPAVVVQSDRIGGVGSIIVCPVTSNLLNATEIRVAIIPTPENGLRLPSQIMVEKINAVDRRRCREIIGRVDAATIEKLGAALALVLGLLD